VHAFIFSRNFGAAQKESNLRAISMTNGHIPAGFDHVRNVLRGFCGGCILILDGNFFGIENERITTNCDNCQLFRHFLQIPFLYKLNLISAHVLNPWLRPSQLLERACGSPLRRIPLIADHPIPRQ